MAQETIPVVHQLYDFGPEEKNSDKTSYGNRIPVSTLNLNKYKPTVVYKGHKKFSHDRALLCVEYPYPHIDLDKKISTIDKKTSAIDKKISAIDKKTPTVDISSYTESTLPTAMDTLISTDKIAYLAENIQLKHITWDQVFIGDRYHVNNDGKETGTILVVSQPRNPCHKPSKFVGISIDKQLKKYGSGWFFSIESIGAVNPMISIGDTLIRKYTGKHSVKQVSTMATYTKKKISGLSPDILQEAESIYSVVHGDYKDRYKRLYNL